MKNTRQTGYTAPDLELLECGSQAVVCASIDGVSEETFDFEWE